MQNKFFIAKIVFYSATLFYIVKMKEKGELEQRLKERIVRTLLVGMSIHKNDETMMRNGCLALCQFRLPQDVVRIAFFNYINSIFIRIMFFQDIEIY